MLEHLDLIPMHYLISTPWVPGTSLKNSVVPTTGDIEVGSSAAQRYTAEVLGLAVKVAVVIVVTLVPPPALTVKPEVVTSVAA